ncbi:Uncharacterised protein [Klebsiella quasipneumoniae]|nr:Uncharacterised protein [Klebsiella quasipneumoniae]
MTQRRNDLQLNCALGQIVQALFRGQPQQVARVSLALCRGNIPASKVTTAHVADFTLTDELFHRLPDLLPGRVPIDMVHLIEIDMVRFQPFQAGLTGPADMVGRQVFVVRTRVHRLVNFRGQHYPVTLTTAR